MDDRVDETIRENTGVLKGRAEAALTGMETLRGILQRKIEELAAMPADAIKAADSLRLIQDMAKAVTQAIVEEGKVSDALSKERGGDGIDFGAARAEIGRRLDRLCEPSCA